MAVVVRSAGILRALTSLLLVASLVQSLPGAPPQAIKLRVKETVLVGQNFGPLLVRTPVKCDAKGNVYVRYYVRRALAALPILRIAPDGKPTGTFNLRAASGFEQATAYDFDVGPRGEVYILAETQPKPKGKLVRSIVRFTSEAKYDSAFELEPFLEAHHLAVFSTGEFLLAGEELSERDGKPTGRPLQAVYDATGRFVREISLPRDIQIASGPDGASQDEGQSLHTLTEAVAAEDGNIYLMRRTLNPLVYVVSPAGLVRRFVVPAPAQGFHPVTLKVSSGKIVIQFNEKERSSSFIQGIYLALDAYRGEKYAEYWDTPDTGNIWACYRPQGFTFVGVNKTNQMTLQRVPVY